MIPDMKEYKSNWGVLEKRDWKSNPDTGGDGLSYTSGYLNGEIIASDLGLRLPKAYTNANITHENAVRAFFTEDGYHRRHPDTNSWYGENNRGSRDQLIGGLILLSISGFKNVLWKVFLNHLLERVLLFSTNTRRNGTTKANHGRKHYMSARKLKWWERLVLKYKIPIIPVVKGYRNYNWKLPDLTLIKIWSIYIRSLPYKLGYLFYPLLLLNDLVLLIGTRWPSNGNDVLNHVQLCVFSRLYYPTFISKYNFMLGTSWNRMCIRMKAYSENDPPRPFGSPPNFKLWTPIVKHLYNT